MSERQSKAPESLDNIKPAEVLKAPERHEVTAEELETGKHEQKEQLEQARAKLDQQPEPGARAGEQEAAAPAHHPTKLDKESAYWDTLRSVQRHLKPASRQFSKVIHSPAVERTSEVAGATIARPSVLLGATITASLLGGFLYITARLNGFSLSGSEFILSLLVGGVLGLLVEGIANVLKPRRWLSPIDNKMKNKKTNKPKSRTYTIGIAILAIVGCLVIAYLAYFLFLVVNSFNNPTQPLAAPAFNSLGKSNVDIMRPQAINRTNQFIASLDLGGALYSSSKEDYCYQTADQQNDFPNGYSKECRYAITFYIGYPEDVNTRLGSLHQQLSRFFTQESIQTDSLASSTNCYINMNSLFAKDVNVHTEYALSALPLPANFCGNLKLIEPTSNLGATFIANGNSIEYINFTQKQPIDANSLVKKAENSTSKSFLIIKFTSLYFAEKIDAHKQISTPK